MFDYFKLCIIYLIPSMELFCTMKLLLKVFYLVVVFLSFSFKVFASQQDEMLNEEQVYAFCEKFDTHIGQCEIDYSINPKYKGLSAFRLATVLLESIHSVQIKPEILTEILQLSGYDASKEQHFTNKYDHAADHLERFIRSIMNGVGVTMVKEKLNLEDSNNYRDSVHNAGRYMKSWQDKNTYLNEHLEIGRKQVRSAGLEFARLGSDQKNFFQTCSYSACIPYGALFSIAQNEILTRKLAKSIKKSPESYSFNNYEIKTTEIEKIGVETEDSLIYGKAYHPSYFNEVDQKNRKNDILTAFGLYLKKIQQADDPDGYDTFEVFNEFVKMSEEETSFFSIPAESDINLSNDGTISYTIQQCVLPSIYENTNGKRQVVAAGIYDIKLKLTGDFIIHRMGGSALDGKALSFGHAHYCFFNSKLKKWEWFDNIGGLKKYTSKAIPKVHGMNIYGIWNEETEFEILPIKIEYQVDDSGTHKNIEAYKKSLEKPKKPLPKHHKKRQEHK